MSANEDSQDDSRSHDVIEGQYSMPCTAAAVSQLGKGQAVEADARRSHHPGCYAMPQPAVQHVCLHHMQLPCEKQADPAQQSLTSCSAHLQSWHTPSQLTSTASSSPIAPSAVSTSSARAATALASRAIKQEALSLAFPSSTCIPAGPRSQCHVCSGEYRAADAMSAPVMAAILSQQERCCDCGYVTRSPSNGTFKLGEARPASAGGCRAATAAACRPLSAGASRAATPAACEPLSADMSRAGGATLQNTAAVGQDGAVGDLLSYSLHTAALTPVTQEQQEYRSPLSHLQQSFRSESGFQSMPQEFPTSPAVTVDGPDLEVGQAHQQVPTMAGNHCGLRCLAEVVHSAAAVHHRVHQDAWSHHRDQQLEVSPETSFLQRLDHCQQTDPEPPRAQLDQQQQTEALSVTITDRPDFAQYTGCPSPKLVNAQRQQCVKAQALGSSIAQPQPTAVGTSAVSASTTAAVESLQACSSSFAAVLSDNCQDTTAAGQLLQQDEGCQLGSIVADTSQLMRPWPFAESATQCGNGMPPPPHLLSPPPAPAMPAASEAVAVTASGARDGLAGHIEAFPTSSAAADTPAACAASLPAFSVPNDSPRRCAAHQLGTRVDNAQWPALQPFQAPVAPSNNDKSQGLPVLAELITAQQQRPQHMCSAHAEIEHKDASTEAVDVSVETEHGWLLSTAWAEQRQWLAARRRSVEGHARWELDESGSISGDSAGSVSSESTLRPSSVGRCRVNSGRHAKVGSTLAC